LAGITDIAGVTVGHFTDPIGITGCTVVLLGGKTGAIASVSVRGAAPGTRETDLLRPGQLVEKAQAILFSGGSAYGLDAASGVVRFLEERGAGYPTSAGVVPIVPAAILYDLSIGDPKARPDANSGYSACLAARPGIIDEGSFGAGTGATVGKIHGIRQAMKGGIGTASVQILDGITVAALVAVNCFGDIVEPHNGAIIAGAREQDSFRFLNTEVEMRNGRWRERPSLTNTTIGVIATNASLSKEQVNKVAGMAHDGIARAIRPSHVMFDGDALFAVSLPEGRDETTDPMPLSAIGSAAAEMVASAIIRAVRISKGLGSVPGISDIRVLQD
jgi:L-aminopeptidase/D-esterase-like protein